jgi:hypothetical protein
MSQGENMSLHQIARQITEEAYGPPLEIGKRYQQDDGTIIEIVDGQFWGTYGLSNFWYWRDVRPDGSLSPKRKHGYGGKWPEVTGKTVAQPDCGSRSARQLAGKSRPKMKRKSPAPKRTRHLSPRNSR